MIKIEFLVEDINIIENYPGFETMDERKEAFKEDVRYFIEGELGIPIVKT